MRMKQGRTTINASHEIYSDIIKAAVKFHDFERKLFHNNKQRTKMPKQYQAKEPSINAARITSIAAVTTYTATLDDATELVVTSTQATGDAVIYPADGSAPTFQSGADFDAHYVAV